ncbi:MAG: OmpA family protein [Xanthobacteraceae bacterium]
MLDLRNLPDCRLARVGLALAFTLTCGVAVVQAAEQPSTEQIIRALAPRGVTRSLTTSPAQAGVTTEEARFLDSVRHRPTRSLTSMEREKIAALTENKPSIDIEIKFEFNSAEIGAKAMPQVTALGQALTSDPLKAGTFVLAGHTDAVGADTYNQQLSERRADAVKRFLAARYGIESTHLVAVGYGKSRLKNIQNPFAGENRRVQIVRATEN